MKSKAKVKPFDRKEKKNDKQAFGKTEKSVKPVAKDTNKTRRKDTLVPLKNKIKPKSFKTKSKNEPKGIK